MNRKNMINIRHFLLSFPLLFMACGTSSHQITRLDPASFEARLNEPDVQLVDARTPGEYAAGHLTGATNLDWNGGRLQATVDQLDKTRPVLVYCASGRRSAEVDGALMLDDNGAPEDANWIGLDGSDPLLVAVCQKSG